ncbi:unnamed protein product [Meganyctiphanes norvegica]|uniref:Uncharacterized protein n=1 Tax=Meganyctiphanes norvegica TaxID=48144 RepID=A0AAV2RFW3_MEGNR
MPLETLPGRPHCNRGRRCCHPGPVPSAEQCNNEYGWCIDTGDVCNGTAETFYNSINDHCNCCIPAILSVDDFISKFDKKYENEEEAKKRIKIFQDNVEDMKYHNWLFEYGKSSYMMGVDEYSDMTYDEVISSLTGDMSDLTIADENNVTGNFKQATESYPYWYIPKNIGEEPESMDYRKLRAINRIRNQKRCGSCWAFSAVSSIESQIFLTNGRLVKLSEQYLVDCSKGYAFPNKEGRTGCAGGWKQRAIRYVGNNGIAFRKKYPYTAVGGGLCNEGAPKTSYQVTGIQRVNPGKDAELLNALVNRGPVAVSIFVTKNFRKYKRGVLDDELCNTTKRINHAVVLVGYGNEKGKDYWLIRNSWGKSWGEKGYIKLARTVENHCRISQFAHIPVVEVAAT